MPFSENDALQRFETIWEYVECGICIIDASTREILDINPVAARMFGDAKEKIIGKRCHKFICPAEECSCPIMDKGQVVDRSERKFVRANGDVVPIIKSVAKIQYNGRLALLESFTDISKLKEAEEKLLELQVTEQANRAKSDFLSRMSHEMRTPMNAIIGMSKIAEGTRDVSRLKYCLATIGASAGHLLGLINDVLDMAKIEAGKFDLAIAPMDLEEVLIRLCSFISDKTEAKNIRLDVVFDKEMDLLFLADELRLSQVIANILSNAVKFTPNEGAIRLEVAQICKSPATSLLRFTVTDTGIGMTEKQIMKLFNAFEQADTSISRRFGGTGLGLAISKNIVDKMNGRIEVRSVVNEGSTFEVEIPLQPLKEQKSWPEVDTSLRLLAADANSEAREQFSGAAARLGLTADTATTFREALQTAQKARQSGRPHDVIFLDYGLEDLDGLETARLFSQGSDRPALVLMTSFLNWTKVCNEAEKAGIPYHLTKPIFPSSLVAALNSVAGKTEEAPAIQPAEEELPDFSGVSILLAEDLEINREIFSSLLEGTGIRIDTARDGAEAVQKFCDNPDKYDMIIMDVQMPGMDGHEATRVIRGLGLPGAGTIPIIAMTANAFKEDIARCLECGMNDHLAKPIDEKMVFEKIRSYSAL